MIVKVKKLTPTATIPTRCSEDAVGYDLCSDEILILGSGERVSISTGISLEIPPEYYVTIKPRSGLAFNYGIDVLAGVIDPDYRGEIKVMLINLGTLPFPIFVGTRIAQMIFKKFYTPTLEEVLELNSTVRGEGGFGSTGK